MGIGNKVTKAEAASRIASQIASADGPARVGALFSQAARADISHALLRRAGGLPDTLHGYAYDVENGRYRRVVAAAPAAGELAVANLSEVAEQLVLDLQAAYETVTDPSAKGWRIPGAKSVGRHGAQADQAVSIFRATPATTRQTLGSVDYAGLWASLDSRPQHQEQLELLAKPYGLGATSEQVPPGDDPTWHDSGLPGGLSLWRRQEPVLSIIHHDVPTVTSDGPVNTNQTFHLAWNEVFAAEPGIDAGTMEEMYKLREPSMENMAVPVAGFLVVNREFGLPP